MTARRFDQLLYGPLRHASPIMTIGRLQGALRSVIDAGGEAGEKALEDYCRDRVLADGLARSMTTKKPQKGDAHAQA